MKLQNVTAALAAAALVSTAGAAMAANSASTMSKPSEPSAMHSMTKAELSLTRSQQRVAWKDAEQSGTAQTAPTGFTPHVGATIPTQLNVKPVPVKLGKDVSALKRYDYALLRNELLIVNPSDKKVVEVINRRA